MKIHTIEHFVHGDSRENGIYTNTEFYDVRDEDYNVLARVIREPDWPRFWLARDINDKPITRDKYISDLLDRLERVLNDG